MTVESDFAEFVEHVDLVDHHVHGAIMADMSRPEFESVITESDRPSAPGLTSFESPVGYALMRWCSPILDLSLETTPEEYLQRRRVLGADEVSRRMLSLTGVSCYLVDTGFGSERVQTPEQLRAMTGAEVHEVVRLEAVAERLLREEVSASEFPTAVREAVSEAVLSGAVGTKSVVAYRYGFDLDTRRPTDTEVEVALGEWLSTSPTTDFRIEHPVILSFLLWTGIDAGVPLQIHAGFGDSDLTLHRCNPSLLTEFLRASESFGTPVVFLHCYPYHREAAYLAQMFPHVYFDIGEAINYAGAASQGVLAETFALAPFGKQLFSSDAWGPAELHFLGAHLWRRAMSLVLGGWIDSGDWSIRDAQRVTEMTASGNARRIYGL